MRRVADALAGECIVCITIEGVSTVTDILLLRLLVLRAEKRADRQARADITLVTGVVHIGLVLVDVGRLVCAV